MFIRLGIEDTVYRTADRVKQACQTHESAGYTWYDIANHELSAEVTLLRQSGVIAHHPLVHTLIRFIERS